MFISSLDFLLFDQVASTVAPSCAKNISTMESRLESVKSILTHIDHSDVYILLFAIPLLVVFLLFRSWISAILTVLRWQYRAGYSGATSTDIYTNTILTPKARASTPLNCVSRVTDKYRWIATIPPKTGCCWRCGGTCF